MMGQIVFIISLTVCGLTVICGADHIYSSTEPPTPFVYAYASGRAPNGKPDRYVVSSGDKNGRVEGTYSYLDPNYQWQKFSYVADPEKGFTLTEASDYLPRESAAVQKARLQHQALYQQTVTRSPYSNIESPAVQAVRNQHAQLYEEISQEHKAIAAQQEALRLAQETPEKQAYDSNPYYY
ncbi:uncharacterized protein Cpr57A [Lepeophtheirus salmonis]|uniref:uncharacterized protein Cpr57A n=1 Tax=Lepeophtheirus salmonis TaxID=72036 RepID=UPI001AE509CE|nr:uncharacterized protein LOC121118266 [Lepeophtheirus salmonis]